MKDMNNKKYDIDIGKELTNNKKFLSTDTILGNIEPSLNIINKEGTYSFREYIMSHRDSTVYKEDLIDCLDITINNFGHRSENFNKLEDSKTNILFAGCSITFGEGLPERHSWPYFVHHKLKQDGFDLGPINILSYPGGSLDKIVKNIFRYIKEFGKPDYICIILPDFFRDVSYDKDLGSYKIKMLYDIGKNKKITKDDINVQDIFTRYKTSYEMLEILCSLMNIRLFSGSWYSPSVELMKKISSSTFIDFFDKDISKYVNSKKFNQQYFDLLDSRFGIESADNSHPGTLFHMLAGEKFSELILKND